MNSLTFDELVSQFRRLLAQFPDKRTGKNTHYSLEDAALGAFAVFFTQSPSFLAFQRSMQEAEGRSNAQTLFGMGEIPCDNHIRDLLDAVAPAHVLPMFATIFEALRELGYLEPFRSINGDLLIPLDGTQYHASKSIHCAQCRQTHHRNGQITYSHTVITLLSITPVIAAPGQRIVIPLEPEFITPPGRACQTGLRERRRQALASPLWPPVPGVGRHRAGRRPL
jgi:hypothetical protein